MFDFHIYIYMLYMYTVYSNGVHGGIHKIYYHLHFHHHGTKSSGWSGGALLEQSSERGAPCHRPDLGASQPHVTDDGSGSTSSEFRCFVLEQNWWCFILFLFKARLCVLKMLYHVCGIYDDYKILLKVYPATKRRSRLHRHAGGVKF